MERGEVWDGNKNPPLPNCRSINFDRSFVLATMKKGITVPAGEWWRHLRKIGRRFFWKRQRKEFKRETREELRK